ncbi:hypothetical protein RDWZM_007109 [Blomia tropicalis]|uniref:Uncharacterized protein n=1 Tax=Blomia tropicalis TaxID=40697 RepID=A0A9Q0MBS3_BLOTA|nr:hypothetical protein RDWZM_007109 [Blomia tropicalis]
MFPTKMFAFIAFLLIVLVQLNSIQYAEAGGDDDKIIIGGGHGCPPSFLLKEVLALVTVQLVTEVEAGEKGDTIVIGGHCGPKLVYKEGKKGKGHTIIMGGGGCKKKEESHYGK